MDNKKQNKGNSPFGTFDWSNTYSESSNKPKDITSDMWTPISTGVPVNGTQGSLLKDKQNEAGSAKKSSAKDKKTPPKKPTAQKKQKGKVTVKQKVQIPQKQRPVVSGTRKQPPKTEPSKKRMVSKEELERRQQKFIAEREKRAIINDKRRFEKSREDFHTKLSSGHSSNDVRRRKAIKKKRSKKLVAIILVCSIMLVAAAVAAIYFYMYGAPVQTILVEGKSAYSNAEIIDASGILTGNSMLQIREKNVNKAICVKLPYIKEVNVDYRLPDTVSLEVTPTSEKFLITGTKGYICVDSDSKILSLKKKKLKEGQYKLNGFEEQTVIAGQDYKPESKNKDRFKAATEIVSILEENKLEKANVLFLEDLHNIIIEYDSRINIYIGDTDKLTNKLTLAAKVLQQDISEDSTGYLEARFDNRIFFKEGSKTI